MATNVPSPQPCLVVKHEGSTVEDCYLVIENHIIVKIPITDATFFVFNVHYPHGCTNLYTALEAMLLDKAVIGRRPTVTAYLDRLSKC